MGRGSGHLLSATVVEAERGGAGADSGVDLVGYEARTPAVSGMTEEVQGLKKKAEGPE